MHSNQRGFYWLAVVFTLSGFSGLVYEAVWAQYLKIFLGHAAYAQTVVLCIFMGGLAFGAWLVSRFTTRISRPLLFYAGIEALIGVFGLVFHGVFTRTVDFHYAHLLPLTSDSVIGVAIKGLIALLLLGPQTLLLGATFPLMTSAVLRAFPQESGRKIATLYFSNSAGAAVGVLASVFVLVPWSGLPGTMLTAGLLNILVALVSWIIFKQSYREKTLPLPVHGTRVDGIQHKSTATLSPQLALLAATITGLASFIYEVVWIRMLSLVLGASTHSFELMLSAFITGLALGSLVIRRWIDKISQPYEVLGYIQILMGIFALASLWVYSDSFHWMSALMKGVARTSQGYDLFVMASHLICFAVMLPATFFAGMTLPLITSALMRDGYGERAVGAVYSFNTFGSIAGALLALHVLIPVTGLKSALIIGGGLDLLLGVLVLWTVAIAARRLKAYAMLTLSMAAVVTAAFGARLDPHKLNSAVYRYERPALPAEVEFLYLGDGKTATISLYRTPSGNIVLATNGKPDGNMSAINRPPSGDDVTATLLGAVGLAYHPEARSVATIGLGLGITTRTLLRDSRVQNVDTVEIEPKVVEAVRLLREEVGSVFLDQRSRIFIDDAKSFFAAKKSKYDVIVAEPSNPWVSGVSSLFTVEFYYRMRDHLTDNGVLVQWLQAYEIDMESVASVMLALGRAFPNYTMYSTNGNDILVVAWKGDHARAPAEHIFSSSALRADLIRIGVESLADIEVRRIGGKSTLHALFRSYAVPENSDYFPYLDNRAVRARFMKQGATALVGLQVSALPIMEILERSEPPSSEARVSSKADISKAIAIRDAVAVLRYLDGEKSLEGLLPSTRTDLAAFVEHCEKGSLFEVSAGFNAFISITASVVPYLHPSESRRIMKALAKNGCIHRMGEVEKLFADLIESVISRDGRMIKLKAERLLAALPGGADKRLVGFALDAAMMGAISSGVPAEALDLWRQHRAKVLTGSAFPLDSRLMLSNAEVQARLRQPAGLIPDAKR